MSGKSLLIFCSLLLPSLFSEAQLALPKGEFSGNFTNNNAFYVRDDRIGANTTQYKQELSSAEAWLFLNYKIEGFQFALRYDVFSNSPLLNPQEAYSDQGIGYWQISKNIDKLNITAGYFYDQFGSGSVFRAYEDRLIGIDYAIRGVKLTYDISETFRLKGFTGKQKFRFDVRDPVIKGFNAEKMFIKNKNFRTQWGGSIVNRTIDQVTMNSIASEINSYDSIEHRFVPKFNVFLYNIYTTTTYKNLSLYLEYSGKSKEAVRNQEGTQLVNKQGNVYYASLTYSKKGLGINAQYKRIESFPFRTSPQEQLLNGIVNYLPSVTRQNTYRLLARYNAVLQELGETAYQGDIVYSPNKKMTLNLNASRVQKLDGKELFNEYYLDVNYKHSRKLKFIAGIQMIDYDQEIYENKPDAKMVHAVTPFGEITYKLSSRRSIRMEFQYMDTKQDLGSFVNGLIEYNIAPKYSFSIGDMVNHKPTKSDELIHYYTIFGVFNHKATRFSGGYIKQVQGVNCTGGVCRVEPAFSGGRISVTTTF